MFSMIGRIHKAFHDGFVSHEEYQDVELAVFGGDGVKTNSEDSVLLEYDQLVDTTFLGFSFASPLILPTEIIFENTEDEQRFCVLAEVSSQSVGTYIKNLEKINLEPAVESATLLAAAESEVIDDLPVISLVSTDQDGQVTFVAERDDGIVYYHDLGVADLQSFEDAIYPFHCEEIYLSLQNLAFSDAYPRTQEAAVSVSQQIAMALEEFMVTHPDSKRVSRQQGIFVVKSSTAYNFQEPNIARVTIAGYPDLFWGQEPSPRIEQAVINALDCLPKKIIDDLSRQGAKIHFVPSSQLFRTAAEQIRQGQRQRIATEYIEFRGGTVWDPLLGKNIAVPIDLEPQEVAHSLVHEIGHACSFMIAGLTDIEALAKSDKFVAVNTHFDELKRDAGSNLLTRFFSLYGACHFSEWFAEAFASYYLGRYGENSPNGLVGLHSQFGAGHAYQLEQFRQRDPVGYLLIAKMDQLYSQRQDASLAFSIETLQEATNLVDPHSGQLSDVAERQWFSINLSK